MTIDPNSFLMGGGVPSAKFKNHGDEVWGVIVDASVRQQTDFETNEPLYWQDGTPRMQLVITLKTEQHEGPDDDGQRRVYAKGKMLNTIREAVKKAGAEGIAEGGKLLVRYVSDGEPKRRGMSGEKLYMAKYAMPEVVIPEDGFNDGGMPDVEATPF